MIPAVDGDYTFRPGKHACQPVNATRNFFWIPYFGTVLKAKSTDTVIATVILPVDDDSEAASIARSVKRSVDGSGNLSLSFTKAGKTYQYSYKKGSEGLVLEK